MSLLEALLAILATVVLGIQGVIHKDTRTNAKKLAEHELILSQLAGLPETITKHEIRDKENFIDMRDSMNELRNEVRETRHEVNNIHGRIDEIPLRIVEAMRK